MGTRSSKLELSTHRLESEGLQELWVGFGKGKHYKDIPIHTVSRELAERKCKVLPLFHSLTGCDYTSYFRSVGKLKFWSTWENMPELTNILLEMTENPEQVTIDCPQMSVIQRFVIKTFSLNCETSEVNEARQRMFTTGLRLFENLPPTKHALLQHTKRSLLAAAFIWKYCLQKSPTIPNFSAWGWEWHPRLLCWVPYWTDLSDVSKGCSFLGQCGCKVACTGRCGCHIGNRRCSSFCKYKGTCSNNDRFD